MSGPRRPTRYDAVVEIAKRAFKSHYAGRKIDPGVLGRLTLSIGGSKRGPWDVSICLAPEEHEKVDAHAPMEAIVRIAVDENDVATITELKPVPW